MSFVPCSHKHQLHKHTHTQIHTTTRDAFVLVSCVKDRAEGQRARAKGHHSGDEVCPSPGQYETKPEFRKDDISTVSSLPSPPVRIRSLCRNLKECWSLQTQRNHITPESFHPLAEVISRSTCWSCL